MENTRYPVLSFSSQVKLNPNYHHHSSGMEGNANLAIISNAVFSQELLRELILHHVIPHRQGGIIGAATSEIIRSLRLVSGSWLQTVTKLLRKRKEPLFRLSLGQNSLQVNTPPPAEESSNKLDQFVNELVNDSSEPIPTISLDLGPVFFSRRENHESFSNFLQTCGVGLLDIFMCLSDNGSLPFILPRLSLPQLKRLGIMYCALQRRPSNNPVHLIHAVLSGADALNEFMIYGNDPPPQDFEFLILPSSITTLEIDSPLKSCHLDLLIKNTLPNLSILKLLIPVVPFSNGLLFRVLDRLKTTLRVLEINNSENAGPTRMDTLLSLPVMEKLEKLYVISTDCELEPNLSSLERCLPHVISLALDNQTVSKLQKWTENSRLGSVRDLQVGSINDHVYDTTNRHYRRSLDLGLMQRIHLAFPNIRKLEVMVSAEHIDVLKYMFRDMQALRDLKIYAGKARSALNSDFWDALLIGTTAKEVAALRTNPDWRLVELNNDHVPSIKMLKDLKTLHLRNDYYNRYPPPKKTQSLISDLVFHFALLRMSKLKHLVLEQKFYASTQMAETWRNQERTLIQGESDDESEIEFEDEADDE